MFPTFENFRPCNVTETNKELFTFHLGTLQKVLLFYFKDINVSKSE
jgi:hypothetical protein